MKQVKVKVKDLEVENRVWAVAGQHLYQIAEARFHHLQRPEACNSDAGVPDRELRDTSRGSLLRHRKIKSILQATLLPREESVSRGASI